MQFPDWLLQDAVDVLTELEVRKSLLIPSQLQCLHHPDLPLQTACQGTADFYILADTSYREDCVDEVAAQVRASSRGTASLPSRNLPACHSTSTQMQCCTMGLPLWPNLLTCQSSMTSAIPLQTYQLLLRPWQLHCPAWTPPHTQSSACQTAPGSTRWQPCRYPWRPAPSLPPSSTSSSAR